MKERKAPVMWCMQDEENGYLFHSTLAFSKGESQQKMFDNCMDVIFCEKYWKKWTATLRAYRKMGYKAIRVRITPLKEKP